MNRLIRRDACSDYGAIEGVNISTLIHIGKSPRHYKWRRDHPSESTDAMKLGTAIHAAVLEPDVFARDYWCNAARMRPGQKRGGCELTASQYETATAVASSVRSDMVAMRYLMSGEPEVAMQWIDAETGIQCRGRIDWVTPNRVIPDLKSARDVGSFGFCRQAAALEYHTKMAWYADGYETIIGHKPEIVVIAVENVAPYDVVCYKLEDDPELDAGRDNYKALLSKLQYCTENNDWPGQSGNALQRLVLPRWCLPEEDGDVLEGMEF